MVGGAMLAFVSTASARRVVERTSRVRRGHGSGYVAPRLTPFTRNGSPHSFGLERPLFLGLIAKVAASSFHRPAPVRS